MTSAPPPYPTCSRAEWMAAIATGDSRAAIVLTPNQRLARAVRQAYGEAQIAEGNTRWPTPRVLPWSAWLTELVTQAEMAGASAWPRRFSPLQSQALWRRVIANAERDHAVNLVPLATLAAEARELMERWHLRDGLMRAVWNEDIERFKRWLVRYEGELSRARAVDHAALAASIAARMQKQDAALCALMPRTIVLYRFDLITPDQRMLLDALGKVGVTVTCATRELGAATVSRHSLPSPQAELEAMAAWSRTLVERAITRGEPLPKIGLVLPDLSARRADVERALRRAFETDVARSLVAPDREPFNLSIGVALSDEPLPRIAMDALTLAAQTEIATLDAMRLLRSPWLGGAESERAARTRADVVVRRDARLHTTLNQLIKHCGRSGATDAAERLQRLDSAMQVAGDAAPPSVWAGRFAQWLATLGLPGERSLESRHFQAWQAWQGVLAQLARLDPVLPRISRNDALAELRQVASATVFQPESGDAPVQVLGVLESAGLDFDYLWVGGLTDLAWPRPVLPNPLVPAVLQRSAGVPESSAEHAYALDQAITAGWLSAAREVRFSAPLAQDERLCRPSALIAMIEHTDVTPNEGLPFDARPDVPALEQVQDAAAPLAAETPIGGTHVLADQAACPFRAWARYQADAVALEVPHDGVDARERGTLVHAVLRVFWQTVRSQAALLAMDELAVRDAIDQVVASVLRDRPEARRLTPRERDVEAARLSTLLAAWLDVERKREPFVVEASEKSATLPLAGHAMRLRLDRIDCLPDGERLVIDYKTGSVSPLHLIGPRIEAPQLPCYALAEQTGVSGVAFAQLRRDSMSMKGLRAGPVNAALEQISVKAIPAANRRQQAVKLAQAQGVVTWPELMAHWQGELQSLAAAFAAGEARIDPKRGTTTCNQCDLHTLCRIVEQRPPLETDAADDDVAEEDGA